MGKMKIDLKQWFFSDKRRLAITISIIIIIIIAIAGTSTILNTSSSSEVTAIILVNEDVQRVGESFIFDGSNSSGDIKSYSWDFGDGSVSDEVQPTHQYEQPGWYNVTLTVEGKKGNNDTVLVTVGVQYDDEIFTQTLNRMFSLYGTSSVTRNFYIGPNIGNPTITVDITLDTVVGNLFALIYILDQLVYLNSFTATGSSYTMTITIDPEDIPEGASFQESQFYFEIGIDEGYWSGGAIDYHCIFPMENVIPPSY